VDEHVALLCSQIGNHGFEPLVVFHATEDLLPLRRRLDALGVPYITHKGFGEGPRAQWATVRWLARLLREQRADLLHVHLVWYDGGLTSVLAAHRADIPVVVTHHVAPLRPLPAWQRWKRRPFLHSVARFVSVSQANRECHIRWMGLPPERTVCIPNGIQAGNSPVDRHVVRQGLCQEIAVSPDTPLVGCVGRLVEQKGYHYLIRAVPEVLAKVPEAHFVIVGEGHLLGALQEQAARHGIAARVHWLGFREDAARLMAAFDVMAMPSEFEGLPIVLLEAMAVETPVVAHAVGGVPEVITDGVEGFLVERGDIQGLAEQLSFALTHPEVMRKMGCCARKRLLQEFTVEAMAERYAALYREVLNTQRLHRPGRHLLSIGAAFLLDAAGRTSGVANEWEWIFFGGG